MGEIIEIFPSSDERTRAVRLRTRNGEITRSILKLFPLLSAEQLRPQTNQREHVEQAKTQQVQPEATSAGRDEIATATVVPSSRPQRAAKTAGRKKVQQWANDLLEDDADRGHC